MKVLLPPRPETRGVQQRQRKFAKDSQAAVGALRESPRRYESMNKVCKVGDKKHRLEVRTTRYMATTEI